MLMIYGLERTAQTPWACSRLLGVSTITLKDDYCPNNRTIKYYKQIQNETAPRWREEYKRCSMRDWLLTQIECHSCTVIATASSSPLVICVLNEQFDWQFVAIWAFIISLPLQSVSSTNFHSCETEFFQRIQAQNRLFFFFFPSREGKIVSLELLSCNQSPKSSCLCWSGEAILGKWKITKATPQFFDSFSHQFQQPRKLSTSSHSVGFSSSMFVCSFTFLLHCRSIPNVSKSIFAFLIVWLIFFIPLHSPHSYQLLSLFLYIFLIFIFIQFSLESIAQCYSFFVVRFSSHQCFPLISGWFVWLQHKLENWDE